MKEQAKFTQSTLGKAFEKRTIGDQVGKQIKAIEEHMKNQVNLMQLIKKHDFNIKKFLKQNKIFNKLIDERRV